VSTYNSMASSAVSPCARLIGCAAAAAAISAAAASCSWTGSANSALEGGELVCSCGGIASGAAVPASAPTGLLSASRRKSQLRSICWKASRMKSQLLSSVGGASEKFSSLKSQLPGSPKKIPEHFNDDRCSWYLDVLLTAHDCGRPVSPRRGNFLSPCVCVLYALVWLMIQ
jgi:hypothetical protein